MPAGESGISLAAQRGPRGCLWLGCVRIAGGFDQVNSGGLGGSAWFYGGVPRLRELSSGGQAVDVVPVRSIAAGLATKEASDAILRGSGCLYCTGVCGGVSPVVLLARDPC